LHEPLPPADELPWTISYVIRKRAQLDSYAELPKEKRPPDWMIWYGTNEEIDEWFDKVFERKKDRKGKNKQDEFVIMIPETDIG
jgi:hypothetical protein